MHSSYKIIKYQKLTDQLKNVGLNPSKFQGGEQIMNKILELSEESRISELRVQDVKNKFENLLWFKLNDDAKIQIKFSLNELGNTAHQFPSSLSETSDVVNDNLIYFWENNNETLVINIAPLYSCPDRNKIVGHLENITRCNSDGKFVSIIREELNKYTKRLWKREHDYFKKILKNAEILGIALDQNDHEAFLNPKPILKEDMRQVMESNSTMEKKKQIIQEESIGILSENFPIVSQSINECSQPILACNNVDETDQFTNINESISAISLSETPTLGDNLDTSTNDANIN